MKQSAEPAQPGEVILTNHRKTGTQIMQENQPRRLYRSLWSSRRRGPCNNIRTALWSR